MSDDSSDRSGSDSRRSFMKKGALASGALALGLGSAAGQQTPTPGGDGAVGGLKGLIMNNAFHPAARFSFTSGVVEWSPNVPGVQDNIWANYDTYMIRWLNTNEIVPFYVDTDANLGAEYDDNLGFIPDLDDDANQPQLWEMNREFSPFGDNPQLVSVNFSPVQEGQEDAILANDDWWQDGGGTGGGGAGGGGGGGGTPTGTPGGG